MKPVQVIFKYNRNKSFRQAGYGYQQGFLKGLGLKNPEFSHRIIFIE